MRPVSDFIIKPEGGRYNNSTKVGDTNLILNTEVFNHQYINRVGIIQSTPIYNPIGLVEDSEVIVHHNVFRRWHDYLFLSLIISSIDLFITLSVYDLLL